MAARDCRLFGDLLPDILAVIDQPVDDPSQIAFPMSQLVRAGSLAQDECFRLASQLDSDLTIVETIITVPAQSQYVILPANCRAVRATMTWNTTENTKGRDLACGEWSQLGRRQYDCLFKPMDADHPQVSITTPYTYTIPSTLRFLLPTPQQFDLKLVYEFFPIRLAYGQLPLDAGANHMTLNQYEPSEGGILAGQRFYITKDPAGTAADQSHLSVDWIGSTRTIGFLVAETWNPIPKKGATYDTRPALHRDWEQFFIFQTASFLGKKLPPRIVDAWDKERERLEKRAQHQGGTLDRRAAKIIRSRSQAGPGFTGDPINRPTGW